MPSSRKPARAKRVVELDHPLVRDHLTRLRDVQTLPDEFRRLVARLTWLLAVEATRDLRLRRRPVDTPLARYDGQEIAGRVGLVPILRAGLGMVDPVLNLIPSAEVRHLGVYRDESTHQPVEYYNKLPSSRPVDVALILGPMLASGWSVEEVVANDPGLKAADVLACPAYGAEMSRERFIDIPIGSGACSRHNSYCTTTPCF